MTDPTRQQTVPAHQAAARVREQALEKLKVFTESYMKADPKLSYDSALLKAIRNHPDTAKQAAAKEYGS